MNTCLKSQKSLYNNGMHNPTYKYSDICLLPNRSDIGSRSSCLTYTTIGHNIFDLPIIPANMKTVIDGDIASKLENENLFYIMHRFGNDPIKFITEDMSADSIKSISVGVKEQDISTIERLEEGDCVIDYITIDIAHGHCNLMRKMIGHIRRRLGDSVCIIAGNVCTPDGVSQLYEWGANLVKVGIGQGSPCTTKDKTGFTMPMFSCVHECAQTEVPIIADGGITCTGDIVKALVAGATAVMAGGMFAKCIDSPADVVEINNMKQKMYYGSASAENKGHDNNIEGVKRNLDIDNLTILQKMAEIKQDLQSAISYAGGRDLSALNDQDVRWRVIG